MSDALDRLAELMGDGVLEVLGASVVNRGTTNAAYEREAQELARAHARVSLTVLALAALQDERVTDDEIELLLHGVGERLGRARVDAAVSHAVIVRSRLGSSEVIGAAIAHETSTFSDEERWRLARRVLEMLRLDRRPLKPGGDGPYRGLANESYRERALYYLRALRVDPSLVPLELLRAPAR